MLTTLDRRENYIIFPLRNPLNETYKNENRSGAVHSKAFSQHSKFHSFYYLKKPAGPGDEPAGITTRGEWQTIAAACQGGEFLFAADADRVSLGQSSETRLPCWRSYGAPPPCRPAHSRMFSRITRLLAADEKMERGPWRIKAVDA